MGQAVRRFRPRAVSEGPTSSSVPEHPRADRTMFYTDPYAVTLPHHHPARTDWRPGRTEPDSPGCPGCGSPMELGPAGPTEPHRFVGVCSALQCGEVVSFRMLERRLIVEQRRRR
jgi:hypothetical protein